MLSRVGLEWCVALHVLAVILAILSRSLLGQILGVVPDAVSHLMYAYRIQSSCACLISARKHSRRVQPCCMPTDPRQICSAAQSGWLCLSASKGSCNLLCCPSFRPKGAQTCKVLQAIKGLKVPLPALMAFTGCPNIVLCCPHMTGNRLPFADLMLVSACFLRFWFGFGSDQVGTSGSSFALQPLVGFRHPSAWGVPADGHCMASLPGP